MDNNTQEFLQPPKGSDENEWRHYATRMFVQYQIRDLNSRIDYMVKSISDLTEGQIKMMALLQEMKDRTASYLSHKNDVETTLKDHEKKHHDIEVALPSLIDAKIEHEKALEAITKEMPTIKLARNWVIGGVLSTVGIVGASALTIVVKLSSSI